MEDTPTPTPSPPPPRHDNTSLSEAISTSPNEGDVPADDENDPVEVCAIERHPYHNYSKASLYQMWQSQKAVVVDLKRLHTTLRKAINDKDCLIVKYDRKIQSYEKKLDRVNDLQQNIDQLKNDVKFCNEKLDRAKKDTKGEKERSARVLLEVKETSKLTIATRDMRNNIEVGKYQLEVQRLKLELSAREQQMKRVETDVEEYKSRVKNNEEFKSIGTRASI